MRFWNNIEFLTKCHQSQFSSSSFLEMASKTKVIPLLKNGQNISYSFLSISACKKKVICVIDLSIFKLIYGSQDIIEDSFSFSWLNNTYWSEMTAQGNQPYWLWNDLKLLSRRGEVLCIYTKNSSEYVQKTHDQVVVKVYGSNTINLAWYEYFFYEPYIVNITNSCFGNMFLL